MVILSLTSNQLISQPSRPTSVSPHAIDVVPPARRYHKTHKGASRCSRRGPENDATAVMGHYPPQRVVFTDSVRNHPT